MFYIIEISIKITHKHVQLGILHDNQHICGWSTSLFGVRRDSRVIVALEGTSNGVDCQFTIQMIISSSLFSIVVTWYYFDVFFICYRTSEFLGCMSFDVRHVYTKVSFCLDFIYSNSNIKRNCFMIRHFLSYKAK